MIVLLALGENPTGVLTFFLDLEHQLGGLAIWAIPSLTGPTPKCSESLDQSLIPTGNPRDVLRHF